MNKELKKWSWKKNLWYRRWFDEHMRNEELEEDMGELRKMKGGEWESRYHSCIKILKEKK